jgi:hypothetical protein
MLVYFEIDKSTYEHSRDEVYQADMQATIIKLNDKSFSSILFIVAFFYNYIVIIKACMI